MKTKCGSKGKSAVRKTFDLKPKKPLKPEDDKNVKLNKESITQMLGHS